MSTGRKASKATCPVCGQTVATMRFGMIRQHGIVRDAERRISTPCAGTYQKGVEA